jgi:hypothetical protein
MPRVFAKRISGKISPRYWTTSLFSAYSMLDDGIFSSLATSEIGILRDSKYVKN